MITAPGIYQLAEADYHADPCERPSLSSSIARVLCTASPIHAWTRHPKLNPAFTNEEADHFDIGTAAHALLLEGADSVAIIDAKDWRTNAAKEAKAEARKNGQIPFLVAQWDAVQAMVEAAQIQLGGINATPPLFTDGLPEQTLIWEENGVQCRALVDWLRGDRQTIDDYKTTSRTANPESWSRSLFGMGYDIQAAFYRRGILALTGETPEFRFCVQETAPPYALSVVGLTPGVLELADAKVDYAIAKWRECLESGVWPGYPTDVCYAELPGWEAERWFEREEREQELKEAA